MSVPTVQVCSIALDRDEEYVATAGVSKSIRIYRFADLVTPDADPLDPRYPVLDMSSRSKLSCVCYNTYIQHRLVTCDYEGLVQLWDTHVNAEVRVVAELL